MSDVPITAPKQITLSLNWVSILKWAVPVLLGIVGGCFGKQKIDEWRKPDAVLPYLRVPAKVQVVGNQWIPITADTNGKLVKWVSLTPGIEPTPPTMLSDPTGKTQIFTLTEPPNYASKEYLVLAYTALGDVPSDWVRTTITVIGNGPTPPPVPPVPPNPVPPIPPTPVPPAPVDPLVGQLQLAYLADTSVEKPKHKADLAALFRQAAETEINNPAFTTSGQLQAHLHQAANRLMANNFATVRLACWKEVQKVWPSENTQLDPTTRSVSAQTFRRIASALDQVK